MDDLMIEAHGLTKRYGAFTAVDGLDLAVRRGEVYGLLGPNGSGKTTTILMLLGLTEPTAGTVRVVGFDPVRQPLSVKSRAGYMPDEVGFYDELSAVENLAYIAKLNGIPRPEAERRIRAALERVGLSDVAHKRVGQFSRGMRQRLGVADVLIKQPLLIIMDEPTQGLDPEAAREFLQIISGLSRDGITVVLSSHLLHQVQAVCDRVGLFHRGRKVLEGSVSELAQRVLDGAYRVDVQAHGSAEAILAALRAVPGAVEVAQVEPGRFELRASSDLRAEAAEAVVRAGARLLSLAVETPSLDDIYARYFQEVSHATSN